MGTRTEPICLLLAEDDFDLRTILKMAIEGRGHSVVDAEDGAQALEIIKDERIILHLVITDLRMRYNGWSLLEEIARDDDLTTIPIIVMSSYDPHETDVPIEPIAYFRKPVELQSLLQVIDNHCAA